MLAMVCWLLLLGAGQGAGQGTGQGSLGWQCPAPASAGLQCGCELAHTLRCDGEAGPAALRSLLGELAAAPARQSVALLDLSVRGMVRLPARLFTNLSLPLSGLVISTGALTRVPPRAFTGLERGLRALGLPDNKLQQPPTAAMQPLQLLTRLDLSGNLLTGLHSLPALPELEYLDLSRNQISVLAAGVTRGAPSLRTLVLSSNRLGVGTLSQHSLAHLTYLTHLHLDSNRLEGSLTRSATASIFLQ